MPIDPTLARDSEMSGSGEVNVSRGDDFLVQFFGRLNTARVLEQDSLAPEGLL